MYLGIYGEATDSPLLFWHQTVAIPTRMRMVRLPKLNRVTQVTAADGGIARYFHDANGDLNRLVTRQLPALPGVPADLVTTAYDDLNNPVRLADNDSVIVNTFDIASRLVGTTQTWGGQNTNLGYAYDTFNRLATMSEPTGITAYTYDARAMLASLTDPGGNTFAFSYDALGRMASQSAPNGIVTTPTFDAASQLTALNHNLGGTSTVASAAYTLNNTGSRSSELRDHRQAGRLRGRLPLRQSEGRDERARASQHGNTRSFGYDFVDRVLSATNSLLAGQNEAFAYDLEGNWAIDARQHDAFNQLLEDDLWTYQYDLEGNLTGNSVTHWHQYDGEGRRIGKKINGTQEWLLHGGYDLIESHKPVSGDTVSYIYEDGIDQPL